MKPCSDCGSQVESLREFLCACGAAIRLCVVCYAKREPGTYHEAWKNVKHGDDCPVPEHITRLEAWRKTES